MSRTGGGATTETTGGAATGLSIDAGVTSRGGAMGAAGGAVGVVGTADAVGAGGAGALATGGGAITGLLTMAGGTAGIAGGTGRAGGAAAVSFRCVMAFSTSPGREICDKSILVLISSSPRGVRADRAEADPSAVVRKCTRTFSASKSSSELEWVFFSVTPTACRTSRIALLLTSNSLARSLIRTFIRPFLLLSVLRSSSEPHLI